MARKNIGNQWNRDNRNAMNDNFIELYDNLSSASEAKPMAEKAVAAAEDAKAAMEEIINNSFEQGKLDTHIEDKLTDLETQYAPKLTEVTTQLAQKANQSDLEVTNKNLAQNETVRIKEIKQITAPVNLNEPVVTFVSDDAFKETFTLLKPLLDEKGIKHTVGVVTNNIGASYCMTIDELKQLQDEGHDIVSHSKTHSASVFRDNLVDVSDSAIHEELRDSQNWLIDNGFKGFDTLIFPYGNFGSQSTRYKWIARNYYKYAMDATGAYNISPVDNMYLQRKLINKNEDFTTVLQPIIDDAIAKKAWLILFCHPQTTNEFDVAYMEQVIDYIKSKRVRILTFSEAEKLKGNAIAIGEYTGYADNFYLSNNGTVKSNLLSHNVIKFVYTGLMDDPISAYPKYKVTITEIKNTDDTLTGSGGNMETFHGDAWFSFQRYYSVNGNLYYRRWNENNQAWDAFKQVSMV